MSPETFMQRALMLAAKAKGRTHPNPMVGCVIVRDGRVVGEGLHRRAGGPHAEIDALERAGDLAAGADVYVNLEPCDHQGRTGPCTQALLAAGCKRVFVSMRDPNPLVDGKGLRRLRQAGVEVHLGLLRAEAERLNEVFVHKMRTGRPFVVAKIAQSLDGRVATRLGASQWITSPAARRLGHQLRGEYEGILVGAGTVRADDPRLTCRTRGRDPVRIVLDTRASISPKAQVLAVARESQAPTLIITGSKADPRRRRALERAGGVTLTCRTRGGAIDLQALMALLMEQKIGSVLVEGGPRVLGSFVDARLVDKVHAFVAPLLIGGQEALGSLGAQGAGSLEEALRLDDLQVNPVGPDLHIVGYPRLF